LKTKRPDFGMLKVTSIVVVVLSIAPFASAEIFKCPAKNGMDLYQNFPCQFDSMGSLPTDPRSSTAPSPRRESNQMTPHPVALQAVASGGDSAVPVGLRIGMSTDEVRTVWGEPTDTVQEEPGRGPRVEIWAYGTSRSVRFDHRGRVTAFQQ
jgi:hypothetical protein